MTDAESTRLAVLAERYGEDIAPIDGGAARRDRLQEFVATMRAIIAWFIAHPEVPVPDRVVFSGDVAFLEELVALAEKHDTHVYPERDPRQATLRGMSGLPDESWLQAWMHVTVADDRAGRPL